MSVYQSQDAGPSTTTDKRAAIYLRVSTDDQEENGSLRDQREQCQRLAERNGWRVVAIYQDVESGANPERPQFHAMVDSIRRKELDILICWKRDRLSRDTDAVGYVSFEAKRAGVELSFVLGNRANNLEGRVLNAFDDARAEQERADIALRTQAGVRRRVYDDGLIIPGPRPPYGFQWADPHGPERPLPGSKVRAKTRLIPDPAAAPVVKRIYEHIASGGTGRQLERMLTAEGIPTPLEHAGRPSASSKWRISSIRRMVRNPVYKGQPQAFRWKVGRKDLASVEVPLSPITEPFQIPEGAAVPLVSPEVWQRANDQLDRNQRESTRNNSDPEATLLRAGYAVCGYCGHPLVVNRIKGIPSYRCAPQNTDDHEHPEFGIRAHILDEAVWTKAVEVLTDPSYVRQYMQEWLNRGDTTQADLERAEAELLAIEVKERRVAQQLPALDDPAPAVKVLNELNARKRVLLVEQNNLKMRRRTYQETLDRWDAMLAHYDRFGVVGHPRISAMTYAEKRFWLANLNVKAEVWQRGGGPEGQQYRIAMAIDESFWLPSEDELTGQWIDDLTRLQAGQRLIVSTTATR